MENKTSILVLILNVSFSFNAFAMQGGQKPLVWGGDLKWEGTLDFNLKPAVASNTQTNPSNSIIPAQVQEIDALKLRLKNKSQEIEGLLKSIENEKLSDDEKQKKFAQAQKMMAEQGEIKKEYIAKAIAAVNKINS